MLAEWITDNLCFTFQLAHVIREIRQFQQTPYKIVMTEKVMAYILDPDILLGDDDLYERSLQVEPRSSRLSASYTHTAAAAAIAEKHNN